MKKNNHSTISFTKRKETKVLTIYGWLLLIILILSFFFLFIIKIHPFLATYRPIDADILVVEGWLPDITIERASKEFNYQDYLFLITTGGLISNGAYFIEDSTFAELSASTLKKFGLKEDLIIKIPFHGMRQDLSYVSALALKRWLLESDLNIKSLNILSLGSDSRRSWLVYKRVLGKEISVGIIPSENPYYDPENWWKSINGVRTVLGDAFGYLFTFFFFNP